jgi:hypothetical protein
VDRTWDEEGSKAYAPLVERNQVKTDIVIPQKHLEEAFVFLLPSRDEKRHVRSRQRTRSHWTFDETLP